MPIAAQTARENEGRGPVGERRRQRAHGRRVGEHERGEERERDHHRSGDVTRRAPELGPVPRRGEAGLAQDERAHVARELLEQLRHRLLGLLLRELCCKRINRLGHDSPPSLRGEYIAVGAPVSPGAGPG